MELLAVLIILFAIAGLLIFDKTRDIGRVLLTILVVICTPFAMFYVFIIAMFSAGNNILVPICAPLLCLCIAVLILGVVAGVMYAGVILLEKVILKSKKFK